MNRSMATLPELTGLTRKISENKFLLALVLAQGLLFAPPGASAAAEPAPDAKVGVYARHVGGKIAYYYRVTNKSPLDIVAVSIGYDTMNDNDPGNDVWELSGLPAGWNPRLGIPAANSSSPTGWRVSLTAPGDMPTPGEDGTTHAITWEIMGKKSPVLSSGQTLAKMSVSLDKPDDSYMNGHALLTFSSGTPAAIPKDAPAPATKSPPMHISVPVERLDVRPPTFVANLNPGIIWSPENGHIAVHAAFPIKEDDFDSLPEIRLESITANEPLEPDDIRDASYGLDDRYLRLRAKRNGSSDRIYTVTYSATDASGNQALASATVRVPASAPEAAPAIPASAPATAP